MIIFFLNKISPAINCVRAQNKHAEVELNNSSSDKKRISKFRQQNKCRINEKAVRLATTFKVCMYLFTIDALVLCGSVQIEENYDKGGTKGLKRRMIKE